MLAPADPRLNVPEKYLNQNTEYIHCYRWGYEMLTWKFQVPDALAERLT